MERVWEGQFWSKASLELIFCTNNTQLKVNYTHLDFYINEFLNMLVFFYTYVILMLVCFLEILAMVG